MMGIVFSPLVDWPVIWAAAVLCAVSAGLALWRGLPGWWLRLFGFVVLLMALAGPALRDETHEPLTNVVFVVADRTESQLIALRQEQMETGLAALYAGLGRLENFETRPVEVTNNPGAADDGSFIMAALAEAASEVAETRIAGALVLTDGRIHDAALLDNFPAPVHVLLTGEENDWDRRLIVENVPAFAIVGEPGKIFLRIEDHGAVPANVPGRAQLRISVDGGLAQEFLVETGRRLELPFALPHAGMNVLQFTVLAEEGELTDRNNSAVISINGVRDRLRVLLVSGEPYAGGRTWRNLLKSDSSVDLVHFTILRSPDKQDGVPVRELSLIAFPTRELFVEKIDEFDLIIFDRYRRRGILPGHYMQNVAEYVKNGGAVLVASGRSFSTAESISRTPLADVLPALPTSRLIERGYHPRISELGNRHPVTEGLAQFAPASPSAQDDTPGWGRWFRLIEAEVKTGDVLMTGADNAPLLVLGRAGAGRIAMILSDHTWLWSRGFEGGGPQLELLRRLAHWMMKEPELEEERITAEVTGDRVTVTRRSLGEEHKDITVTGPDGSTLVLQPRRISPGRWVTGFSGKENGIYRLTDGELLSVVAIGPVAPREFEKTIASAAAFDPIMAATGGAVLRLEEVAEPRGWLGVTNRDAYVATDIRQSPLLPGWAWLALTVSLMIAAWRYEGR